MARPSVQPAPAWDISLQQQWPYLIYRYWVHGSELYVIFSSYMEYGGCVLAARFKIPRPAIPTPFLVFSQFYSILHSGHYQPALQQF